MAMARLVAPSFPTMASRWTAWHLGGKPIVQRVFWWPHCHYFCGIILCRGNRYLRLELRAQRGQLVSSVSHGGYLCAPLGYVRICGVQGGGVTSVLVNGLSVPYTFNAAIGVLDIASLAVNLSVPLSVSWK